MKLIPTKVLAALFLFFTFNAFSQSKLEHPNKIYQSPKGKLYVQKSLPVYLYLSTQPNGKGEMIQLESDSTKAYANPMYLDTEGYNTICSPSAVDTVTKKTHYPLTDVVFEVYSDSRAPRTKLSYDASKKYFNGTNLFVGKDLNIELSSRDVHSGVEQILVSVDSVGFKKYESTLELIEEKAYDINYYSVDNVGNSEVIKHQVFHVDLTSPITELVFKGQQHENIISGKTKIILLANDSISGVSAIYYSIDGKAKRKYTYALNSTFLSEGEHTIEYYSVDRVGNTEELKSYAFFVDKTPPILVDEILGNSFVVSGKEYSSGRTKLKLTAIDNKAGVQEIKYSLNNEGYILYEKPFYLSTVSGSLAVVSYAIDYVGNKSVASEKSTRSRAAYVDLTGPQLKYSFVGKFFKTRDTIFINKDTRVKLTANDYESGVKSLNYSVNNGTEVEYKEPFAIEEEGVKLLSVFGFDNVDNSNRIQVNLVVDNTGPEVFSRYSVLPISQKEVHGKQVDVFSSHVVLFLSATDAKVAIDRIYYSINGGQEKMYAGIVDGFKRGMDYEIKVKAHDKLGNINEQTVNFATDNTGPQVFARFSVPVLNSEEVDGEVIDVYPAHVSIFLSVTNAHVAYDKIYYSLNGGAERIYQGIIDGFKPGAKILMKIRAIDRLGNQTKKELKFNLEEY